MQRTSPHDHTGHDHAEHDHLHAATGAVHNHAEHSHTHSRDGQTHTHAGATPQVVCFEQVSVSYGTIRALDNVSFSVECGSLSGVVGPNGGGKSSLLKAVVGLVQLDTGRVLVQGQPSPQMRKHIGFVPQLEQVDWDFPVTVWDVAMMGLTPRRGLFRAHSRANREAAAAALSTVGLIDLRKRGIGELSGGQRRRALLARAIASSPSVLLLDEPMNGLDPTAQHRFLDIIDQLREQDVTVIMSTHDLTCVSARASDVALVNVRLIAYGPPEEVLLESVLAEAFGHQLVVHSAGGAYALHHHDHPINWPGRE
ncbi:MAG: metal ABC transporter ATP-binding protein [Chloroflexota bacterium]|nr:metal ABC transporter ATP-binding protein [Chloroflexota bacterium]MDE2960131.1 metal ABC transporter ATP-binding protein [Chloroflexota bacterium]